MRACVSSLRSSLAAKASSAIAGKAGLLLARSAMMGLVPQSVVSNDLIV